MTGLLTRIKRASNRDPNRGSREAATTTKRRLVVIGNGMVGLKLLELLDQHGVIPSFDVAVFGAEPHTAMDRVNLTRYLYGDSPESLELRDRDWYAARRINLHTGDPVVLVDREEKRVYSQSGCCFPYDQLIFATGSSAHRPEIEGAHHEGVFVYRDLHDLQQIKERAERCGSVAVVGGGLLGLEAAEAFKELGLRTHVIERGSGLMARQLNPEASAVLQRRIEETGIVVHNGRIAVAIDCHDDQLEIHFRNGPPMKTGMVVFATGIRPRDELARACGLEVAPRGGIKVDDTLATSDPDIFAIGECASHKGTVYGLVLPGYEMAAVLADRLAGNNRRFRQADQSAILKLNCVEVASVGESQADAPSYSLASETSYRLILVRKGKLIGAIGIGDRPEQTRVREAIKRRRRLWPWHINRFESSGVIWPETASQDVTAWPESAEVCNCMSVCKGDLLRACDAGCATVEQLAARTGASTVCGTCQPLLAQLVNAPAPSAPALKGRPALLAASVLGGLLSILFLAFEIPFAATVTGGWRFETLWTHHLIKQITGFTLTGLAALSLALSARKRIKRFQLGNFGHWRALHSALGLLTLVLLVTHTGLHRRG